MCDIRDECEIDSSEMKSTLEEKPCCGWRSVASDVIGSCGFGCLPGLGEG